MILPVIPGTLPSGACPSTYQDILNLFSANQTVEIPTGTNAQWVFSASQPGDTTVGWFQLDSLGNPVRPYIFASGAWLAQHPLPPGFTMLWTTTLPTLTTFDGGDANPISPISGPMWEVVTEFEARMPIGVGTLPSGTAIAVGDTGGEEKVTLDLTNAPAHQHFSFNQDSVGDAANNVNPTTFPCRTFDDNDDNVERYRIKGNATEANAGLTSPTGGDAGGVAVPHNNIPPYLGVYLLRRTARQWYAIV